MMITTKITIDLSHILILFNTRMPEVPLDIKLNLVRRYELKWSKDNDYFSQFTQDVLRHTYQDDAIHPLSDINSFFKEKDFINKISFLKEALDIFILNKVNPNIENIKINKIITHTNDKLKVEFNVESWQ